MSTTNDTPTPRTDEALFKCALNYDELTKCSRDLEHDLAAANEKLAVCEKERDDNMEAAMALLEDRPMKDGTYPHLLICNGDHHKPHGADGNCCCCPLHRRIRNIANRATSAEASLAVCVEALDKILTESFVGVHVSCLCCGEVNELASAALASIAPVAEGEEETL